MASIQTSEASAFPVHPGDTPVSRETMQRFAQNVGKLNAHHVVITEAHRDLGNFHLVANEHFLKEMAATGRKHLFFEASPSLAASFEEFKRNCSRYGIYPPHTFATRLHQDLGNNWVYDKREAYKMAVTKLAQNAAKHGISLHGYEIGIGNAGKAILIAYMQGQLLHINTDGTSYSTPFNAEDAKRAYPGLGLENLTIKDASDILKANTFAMYDGDPKTAPRPPSQEQKTLYHAFSQGARYLSFWNREVARLVEKESAGEKSVLMVGANHMAEPHAPGVENIQEAMQAVSGKKIDSIMVFSNPNGSAAMKEGSEPAKDLQKFMLEKYRSQLRDLPWGAVPHFASKVTFMTAPNDRTNPPSGSVLELAHPCNPNITNFQQCSPEASGQLPVSRLPDLIFPVALGGQKTQAR